MANLPTVGGDQGTWGAVLNDYLAASLNADGSMKAAAVQAALGGASSAVKARVVVIGDSETSNFAGGPVRLGAQRAAKPVWGGYYATAGYTLTQIRDNHLPTVLALSGWQKPAACVIFGGTNDVGANSGGGVGTGFSFSSSKTTHLDICNQLVAAGILPILVTLPPRTDATLANTNVRQWNAYILGLGAKNGWPVLDLHGAIVTTGGGYVTGGSADGIHFNGVSNRIAAIAAASQFAAIFPFSQPAYVSRSQTDPQNLLPATAQLFAGAPTGGVAGGWSASGTGCVFSVITGDTTIAGNWQTLNRPTAGSSNAFLHSAPQITSGFSVGDRLAIAVVYQAINFEANILSQTGYLQVLCRDVGNATLTTTLLLNGNQSDCSVNAVAYDEFVVPANTTNIDIQAGVNGASTDASGSTLKLAQPTVINLTALGIA